MAEVEEEASSEERGGFEAYSKQPMLSLAADHGTSTPNRVKEIRKQMVETEESSTSKLLLLLKDMREEMRGKDEQLREELKWRDNHLDEQNKKRENILIAALQRRDDKWREELADRDRLLRVEFKEREKAFINEQLKRDLELLKILEIREKEMEMNLLQKAYAFGYLYKEHQKEIRATI